MPFESKIFVGKREISLQAPVYFIADIAANHDGDLGRAKNLICLAKESGADAVKFQYFLAKKIVSDYGFKNLGQKIGHQNKWTKSVYEIYEDYECDRTWTDELVRTAKDAGIDFLSTPYDKEALELLDPVVPAYKIGSGDITWIEFIESIAQRGKPVMVATGAATLEDVERAVQTIARHTSQIVVMQCNTNYTGSPENFRHINLNVLKTYSEKFPGIILGLSDHTPRFATVMGAIALGARVIEKHFTDDTSRSGPDHPFSMAPDTWKEMVVRTRELEAALGNGNKTVEDNELDTVIVQRRCLRLTHKLAAGSSVQTENLEALRPAPQGAVPPYELSRIIGKTLKTDKTAGDALYWKDLND